MRSASVCIAHGTANTMSPSLLAPESTISFRVVVAVARGTPSTTSRNAESQKFMPPLFGPVARRTRMRRRQCVLVPASGVSATIE